ncbi:MAG: hypothetical protein WC688_04915 [Parachlamydiales bacterium]|jgi:hypothetical protein
MTATTTKISPIASPSTSAKKSRFFKIPNLKINLISAETKNKMYRTAQNVCDFIKENKSIIFFGLTLLFSYFMAPTSAIEYVSHWGSSLNEALLQGVLYGAGILALRNAFSSKPISKIQNDNINYLLGTINIIQTCLSPTYGLIGAAMTSGGMAIKTAFQHLFKLEDREVYFLVPDESTDKA